MTKIRVYQSAKNHVFTLIFAEQEGKAPIELFSYAENHLIDKDELLSRLERAIILLKGKE